METNPNATMAAVLLLVAGLVVAPVAAAAPPGGAGVADAQETGTPSPDGDAAVAPGERLSGVVGVQGAELEGELRERTYGLRVARANSNASKAAVVAETVEDVDRRLRELQQRKERLQQARENGSISEGEYRSRMAVTVAEIRTVQRLANASERTARGLPEETLREQGVNVTAIRTLQGQAANMTGPEVAEVARSIAGNDAGRSMAGEQRPEQVAGQVPENAGPPGNETDGGPPGGGAGDDAGSDADDGTDAAQGGPPGEEASAPEGG